jgi:hypothetical protein
MRNRSRPTRPKAPAPIVIASAVFKDARRAVKHAKSVGDRDAEGEAHHVVDTAKRDLGERGPVWWKDGTPDLNRHAMKNSPYAEWYAKLKRA